MGQRFGPSTKDITISGSTIAIPIASTATVYTDPFELKYGASFGLDYKASSSGNVKLKIELEQSNVLPSNFDANLQIISKTTANAADGNWAVGDSISDIVSALATKTQHFVALSPVVTKYARLKITGLTDPSGNDASTTLRAKIATLEDR